jgi:chorismate mutase
MAAATAVDAAYTVAQGHAITSMTEKARAMLPAKINRNVAGVAPIPILVSRMAKTSAFFSTSVRISRVYSTILLIWHK